MATDKLIEQQTKTCYHCGDQCEEEHIVAHEKDFCCQGCKTVYEMLNENNLMEYYELNDQPGTGKKKQKNITHYEHLSAPEVVAQLVDFQEGNTSVITLFLPQIHCASCVWLLENLHKIKKGILYSHVNLMQRKATITFHHDEISLKALVELLDKIGYPPRITDKNAKESNSQEEKQNRIYYQLGLAGFAFGNVMFFSFPEYLNGGPILDGVYDHYFSYFNLLLSIPVLFYSGLSYLQSAWLAVKHKKVNLDVPIALGIICLVAWSAYEIVSGTGMGYLDSFTGLMFFLLISKIFQQKVFYNLSFDRDYKSYFPMAVTKITSQGEQSILAKDIENGDRLIIRHEEILPVDARLLSDKGIVDYSFVTGESYQIEKKKGDLIYAGARLIGTASELEAVKKVSQSYLTSLWNKSIIGQNKPGYLEQFSNRISTVFTFTIIGIALISLAYWSSTIGIGKGLQVFSAILIIACPCALAMSIPFALGNTLRILARNKFYIKHIGIIENLTRIKAIVFDKTGTLTDPERTQCGYEGDYLTEAENTLLHNVVRHSNHPLSRKLSRTILATHKIEPTEIKEYTGEGILAIINNTIIRVGKSSFVNGLNDTRLNEETVVYIAIGDKKGKFVFSNVYRDEALKTLEKLNEDKQTHILSGDNDAEKAFLTKTLDDSVKIMFRQTPSDKLEYINQLQNKKQDVMMIGDGLNDAGALNQSDVGVAITDDIAYFSPASDVIMEASAISKLPSIFKIAQWGKRVVIINFTLSFLYNIVGLSFAVQGLLSPLFAAIIMPLSSITIIIHSMISTEWAAKRYKL